MRAAGKEIYEFGPFRLDVGEHVFECTDASDKTKLPDTAFRTLVALVRNRGRLVSKDDLISEVWPDTIVEDNNLDKCIHTIRFALGDTGSTRQYIETVRKHGYRFVADVKKIDCAARRNIRDENVRSAADGDHGPTANGGTTGGALSAAAETSNDDGQAIRDKNRVPELPENGVLGFWKRHRNAITAASVVFCVLALGVLMAQTRLFPAGGSGSAAVARIDRAGGVAGSRAFDLYMRGKVKVGSENREDSEAAVIMLEEAVSIDPTLAPAYAQLARAYNTMAFKYSTGAASKQMHENAEVAIEKSLALDPDLAEAHFARGLILWSQTKGFPHEQAISSYTRALELDPRSDETYHQLSLIYSHIGLLDAAFLNVETALRLNPNNSMARFRAGVYREYEGKFDEALSMLRSLPRDLSPLLVDRTTAEVLIQLDRRDEAQQLVDDYLSRFPADEGGSFNGLRALLLAKAGKRAEAEAAISHAAEIGQGFGHFHHTAYNIASAYAALGENGKAVEWLQLAADSGFPNYTYFRVDPNLNTLRRERRFNNFMAELEKRWERFKALD